MSNKSEGKLPLNELSPVDLKSNDSEGFIDNINAQNDKVLSCISRRNHSSSPPRRKIDGLSGYK